MAEIYDLDNTAANNNSAPPEGFPEGMSYASVNNSARELMAKVARFVNSNGVTATTGTGNAYLLTVPQTFASYVSGMRFSFKADRASIAGPVTLRVNTAPTVALVRNDGTALSIAGDIAVGAVVDVTYDGTNFVMGVPVGNVISEAEGNLHYLRQDGTSTATAQIPFALGINSLGSTILRGALDNDPAAGGTQDSLLTLANNSGTIASTIGFDGSAVLTLRNFVDGGAVVLTARRNDSTVVELLNADPEGFTVLNHGDSGTASIRTTTTSAGGARVLNGFSGSSVTSERVLTQSDAPVIIRSALGNSINADTVIRSLGGVAAPSLMTFALLSGVTYLFSFRGAFNCNAGTEPILRLGVRYSGTNSAGSYASFNTGSGFGERRDSIQSADLPPPTGILQIGIPRPSTIDGMITTTSDGNLEFVFGSQNNVGGQVLTLASGAFAQVSTGAIN